ncbi:MAG: glycosyltransferase [Gemmatimonadaceae bacterium]|nr:glycosyltransferase [Gemmatimonadaceae bacterium]
MTDPISALEGANDDHARAEGEIRSDGRIIDLSVIAICIDPDAPILDRFLSSLRQYTTVEYELILIDNGGTDAGVSARLASEADRYLRIEERVSVAAAWNRGLGLAAGRYVLITNDDVVVPRRWFEEMRDVFVTHRTAGLVVPLMNHAVPEQRPRVDISHVDTAGPVALARFRQFIWGAFMLFSRDALVRVGGFTDAFAIAGGEDLDICFKLYEADRDVYVQHRVFVYHEWGSTGLRLLGAARRRELYEANYVAFKARWYRYTKDWDRPPSCLRRWLSALGLPPSRA